MGNNVAKNAKIMIKIKNEEQLEESELAIYDTFKN